MLDTTVVNRRLFSWGQTPASRVPDPDAAAQFVERVGLATLYPVSPEIPNLFHAYSGDQAAKTDSNWDSDSGEVYTWRWILGRREAAFYTAIIRGRPTWVSWPLLPAILRLRGDLRSVEEIYQAGELSQAAFRIAQALQTNGGVLSTGELRQLAAFPTGKEQRAAYLRAMTELDTRLLVAKVFASEGEDMRHTLVTSSYPHQVQAAQKLTREQALAALLNYYLPNAVYVVPDVLAKHLGLPEKELRTALQKLEATGQVALLELPAKSNPGYIFTTTNNEQQAKT